MTESFRYTVKIWLTSICISPIILEVIDQITNSINAAATFSQCLFKMCFLTVLSFFFSSITWMLFFLCAYQLLKIDLPQRYYKAVVQTTGLLLVLLTFYCLDGFIHLLGYPFWTFTICYLLTILACMQLYKTPDTQTYQYNDPPL